MSKRILRKALVLAAAGLLGSTAVATTVGAQTVINPQQTVTNTATFVGPVPAGVTGVNVTVSCKNLVGATSQAYTAAIPVAGGSGVMNFNLTSAAPGTSCTVKAEITGTAPNTALGAITIKVGGGADRPTTASTPAVAGANAVITGDIAVQVSTTVAVTVTYPQITVKKVVAGDEPTAGFAYPMNISCSNTVVTPFIAFIGSGTNDIAGNLYITGGAGFYLTVNNVRVYDSRTAAADVPATPAGSFVGTAANIGGAAADVLKAAQAFNAQNLNTSATTLVPTSFSTANPTGFTGAFALKGGETRSFGINEFPTLNSGGQCEVVENDNKGGVTLYSSSTPSAAGVAGGGSPLSGVQAGAVYKSALTKVNETITVQNWFFGDLVISKVVTGDSKTNIATFEISVACDKGGPKDTFLLKDRQSKVYNNIQVGTNCLVTETRSDGAVASYADNSGDNTTDGRVTIKARNNGCAAAGSPTSAAPGGPTPVNTFNECFANVIVTNNYNPPPTTAAPAAPATTAAPAAPATTAAPAVEAAPAAPVEATPTFTG